MIRIRKNIFTSSLILFLSAFSSYSQSISPTNSSPTGAGTAPLGWSIITGTTDISNVDFWAGVGLCPWHGPVVNPPNGHAVWVSGFNFEEVGTTISDLIIGVDYSLNFYMAEIFPNCYDDDDPILDDGTLQVNIEGTDYLFPFTGIDDVSWSLQTITFTALAPSMSISFKYLSPVPITGEYWNISFGEIIDFACDTLDTFVSNYEVCEGDEVTLSAISLNDGIVTWDGGITSGSPFIPPPGTTTYTATSDYDEDCIFVVDITVIEYPEIELIADDVEICDGETMIFSIEGEADSFLWDPPDIEFDLPYNPGLGTNTYTLIGSNGECVTENSIDITKHANPAVDALVDYASVCIGESIVLTGSGAHVYTWEDGIIDGEPYTPVSPGIVAYFIEGIDTLTGCTNTDYVYVNVYELPDVLASSDDDAVCEGELVTLTGSGASDFEWDLGVTNGVPFAPPLGTTTYTVTGTSIVGCENTATIDITVYTSPEIIASADDPEICEGDEIILTGSGADEYLWDLGIVDGEAFIPAETGTITYTVIGTDDSGCEGTASIEILVHENPIIIASASPMEICEEESIVFSGTGADTYAWDGGITDGVAFIPVGTGDIEYNVVGTNSETGCSNTASVIITVHENPIVSASATLMEVCLGEYTILTGSGADSYVWDGGVIDGISFAPAPLGAIEYTVTGINDSGCEGTASISINVLDCEPVNAGFEVPNSVCVTDCITISDTSLGNVIYWEWEFGPGIEPSTSSVQNPIICANIPGTFTITLTATSETGASSTHSEDFIVHENPIIEAGYDTIINLGGTATLFANSPSAGEYTWTPFNEVDCANCSVTNTSPSQTQLYIVNLIDENGCQASDSALVMVNFLLSVGVPTAFSPNSDGNNDVLFVKGQGLASIYFVIYNRYGERIFETTDQNIGWDGTHLNKDENPGVFTWVLDYTTEDGKTGRLKGNTTLIR